MFKYDATSVQVLEFYGYSLNDYEKPLKTKLPHFTKGLIGNYHYGFNIEHAKLVLEKGLIVNSLLGDIPTATKQAAGRERVLQTSLYNYPSQICCFVF